MTTYTVNDTTGKVVGTLSMNDVPSPVPTPTPIPVPVPPGVTVVKIPFSFSENWKDVGPTEILAFEFVAGKTSAYFPKASFSNASGSNKFIAALSTKPGDFPQPGPDPAIGGTPTANSFGGFFPFVTNGNPPNTSVANLIIGNTYFLNVKNATSAGTYKVRVDMMP